MIVGDQVKQADGTTGVIANVVTVQQTQEMFNLTVSEAHTFYVGQNGWLVHNCDNHIILGFASDDWIELSATAKNLQGKTYQGVDNWHLKLIEAAADKKSRFKFTVNVTDMWVDTPSEAKAFVENAYKRVQKFEIKGNAPHYSSQYYSMTDWEMYTLVRNGRQKDINFVLNQGNTIIANPWK